MSRYIIILWFVFPLQLWAQQVPIIGIGDDFKYEKSLSVTNFFKETVTFDELEKDLIILDFFNTYCTTCIEAMPKYKEIQSQYTDRLRILPVSTEERPKIHGMIERNSKIVDQDFPIVLEDKLLSEMFPYLSVPHLVWIFKNKVIAITMGDMLTSKNIDKILNNETVAYWPIKNDFPIAINHTKKEEFESFTKIGKYKNGLPAKFDIDTIGNYIYFKMDNVAPIQAFLYLYGLIEKLPLMKKERMIFNVAQIGRLLNIDSLPYSEWLQQHAFCYESSWPIAINEKSQINFVISDLSNRLGYKVNLDKREANIWEIVKRKQLRNKAMKAMSDKLQRLDVSIQLLEILNKDFPPILFDTKQSNTMIHLEQVKDFQSLRESLRQQGFDLIKSRKKITSLIISE
ncbi:TlpA family protein disulfide reductase [Sphingobacterium kitahiroshimense]|uniref:Thioredoxin domain-containing protein n=1 Tax=Sphingobacterium kitahiroshimense TaxID=470446 RepID=A0ABV0BVD0_9SPHI